MCVRGWRRGLGGGMGRVGWCSVGLREIGPVFVEMERYHRPLLFFFHQLGQEYVFLFLKHTRNAVFHLS